MRKRAIGLGLCAGLPVLAGPVEAAAIGNALVQARAGGVLSGGLAELRALIRSTAGPTLTPVSFDDTATLNFFSAAGCSYCSEISVCSEPAAVSGTATDFNPAPGSATPISIGASPSTSESGTVISGDCRSKRGA